MPKKPVKNIKNMGASVRARLLNISKQRRQTFQLVLTYYVLERLHAKPRPADGRRTEPPV
jgi:hypothetical protein